MESTIQDKMRCAGVAYQYFLIALDTDQDKLDQARVVFEQHFGTMVSVLKGGSAVDSGSSGDFLKNSLDLQLRIQEFYRQFECFYIAAFRQFKEQHSVLISKDSRMAFNEWLQMFDTEYLKFIRQDSVCREYADILVAITQLSQKLQDSDEVG